MFWVVNPAKPLLGLFMRKEGDLGTAVFVCFTWIMEPFNVQSCPFLKDKSEGEHQHTMKTFSLNLK